MFATEAISRPRPRGELEGIELGLCNNCGYYGGYDTRFIGSAKYGGLKGCMVVLCEYCRKTVKSAAQLAVLCKAHEFHD